MGWKDITEGRKVAKAGQARFIKSEAGILGMEIIFRFEEPSNKAFETITWQGWIGCQKKNEESIEDWNKRFVDRKEATMKTLVKVLGYNGSTKVDEHGVIVGNPFEDKEVEIVVRMQESTKDSSKKYPQVAFVNEIGGSGAFADVTPEMIQSDLTRLGFDGLFQSAVSKFRGGEAPVNNSKTESSKPSESEISNSFNIDDVPF